MILASTGSGVATTIALIVTIGVAGQWLAASLRIPSVLVLLLTGLAVGPAIGIIDPVADLGPALFPAVGLAVGLLLFEGGLTLRFDRLGPGRSVVLRLVTLGAVVTWVIASLATWALFDVSRQAAALIGAILVVSGPTVVIPLLQQVRPREPSAAILRWEAIVIDPIGATLAIVMLDATIEPSSPLSALRQVVITLGAGAAVGLAAAALALVSLRAHAVPDRLHNPVLLGLAVGSYALANLAAPEAGLMATTALGLALANQRWVPASQIAAFSEDIALILLGSLFVTLGAVVDLDEVLAVLPLTLPLIAVLVLVARPAAVWAATVGTGMHRGDKLYLATMAPRGIVAAAVATVFANTLVEETGEGVDVLVPIVFTVVIGTVAFYGLTASAAARVTRVAKPQPSGVALVSNHRFAIEIADLLAANDVPVLLITTSRRTQLEAARRHLLVYDDPLGSERLELALDALGIGRAILLTDDANLASHASYHLADHLGRGNVFHLASDDGSGAKRVEPGYRTAFRSETLDSLLQEDVNFQVVAPEDLAESDTPLFALVNGRVAVAGGGAMPSSGVVLVARRAG